MVAPKRPNLMGLVETKSRPVDHVESPPHAQPVPDRAQTEVASAGPSDLKTMQVRVNRTGWLEMSRLAQDRDIPLETLMVEAFNDVLVKHRKPPVVERRQPAKK